MILSRFARHDVEVLEQRIAPAGAVLGTDFKQATFGANLLHAGQGLTTGNGYGSGHYLVYDQAGDSIVFVTDLNNNSVVDFNEITGIAAGDGLQLISFVDIHGDIVTNLTASDTLSDSDHQSNNNDPNLKGDGLVLLNSSIKGITLRSVQASDFAVNSTTDPSGSGSVDPAFLANRLALSSYSIFGNIFAGKGFGAVGAGLTIDTSGATLQGSVFVPGNTSADYFIASNPTIGSILTGSKAGGETFSFGASNKANDVGGQILPFIAPTGQNGGDIIGVTAADAKTIFNINSFLTGDGGIGARGGNIQNIQLNGDSAGYHVITGSGGRGPSGGAGGSIINFADLNSITGEVILKTGNGGIGSTGTGGAGGTVTLGTLNVAANLNIELGNGGNGFSAGGNGASFPAGIITTPEGGVPFGLTVVGTEHNNSTIGTQGVIDFNNDGAGDYVYTTSSPDQLVVRLRGVGDVNLDGLSNAAAVTVGDFNDDGLPDIAVASKDDGWSGGVVVYLNKGNDNNGVFQGFSIPHYNPLPGLTTGGYLNSSNAVSSLVTGDFNGDGHTDIGVMATYYQFNGGSLSNVPGQVLVVLTNDVANNKGTGSFYADFGTKGAILKTPYATINAPLGGAAAGTVLLQSSAINLGQTDALFTAIIGKKTIDTYTQGNGSLTALGSFALGKIDTNRDVLSGTTHNIQTSDAVVQDFTITDFASPSAAPTTDPIIPGPPDQIADVIALDPNGYLITVAGDGTGNSSSQPAISNPHGSATIPDPANPPNGTLPNPEQNQNSGIFIGAPVNGHGGFNQGIQLVALKSTINGRVALLNYTPDPAQHAYNINEVSLTNSTPAALENGRGVLDLTLGSPVLYAPDPTVVAFDSLNTGVGQGYLVAEPNKIATFPHSINTHLSPGGGIITHALTNNAINITAGNGGDGLVGKGGVGGFIGGGLKAAAGSVVGAVSITFPKDIAFAALSNLLAGNGGKGFSSGGNGGGVTGVSVRYAPGTTVLTSNVTLTAGNGGDGVAGAGGAGGNLASNSIQSGTTFTAGAGGNGLTGGNGGSVTGNGKANIYDTYETSVTVVAGSGGSGVKKGGAGGDVSGFHPLFPGFVGTVGGFLAYLGGEGGDAVAGPGGRGGGVINSSPLSGVNAMGGEIYIAGGDGGTGTVGGAGGAVSNFSDQPSTSANPTIVSFIGGNGGDGTSGAGGAGGGLSKITTPSVGDAGGVSYSGYNFDRAIAGNGGASAGAAGGAGGAVTSVNIGANQGGIAMVAGAGGSGLTAGGLGGSVVGGTAVLGADTITKVLVIAGAGGDAYAFTQNPLDNPPQPAQRPFGGRVGKGGNGGSITGFAESTDVLANVDLIAGNGGSTINYGTITDASVYVGKGGSITNVTVAGNIGSGTEADMTNSALVNVGVLTAQGVKANVPIKSYTDTNGDFHDDMTIADFVESKLRIKPGMSGAPTLDDNLGNVGAVVGIAGQIKLYQTSPGIYTALPAKNGVNGSFTNITAGNLLAAVAGSVNQIAAIQVVSGLNIGSGSGVNFQPGVVGADKDPTLAPPAPYPPYAVAPIPDPTPGNKQDYLDENGHGVVEPVLNGRLIDGAVVYHTIKGSVSGRLFKR